MQSLDQLGPKVVHT